MAIPSICIMINTQIDFDDWKSAGLPMEINIVIDKNLNFGLMGNLDDMTININSNNGTPYIYFDITKPINKTTTINGNFYININSVEGKILYIFNNGKPRKKYSGLIKQYKRFYFDYDIHMGTVGVCLGKCQFKYFK